MAGGFNSGTGTAVDANTPPSGTETVIGNLTASGNITSTAGQYFGGSGTTTTVFNGQGGAGGQYLARPDSDSGSAVASIINSGSAYSTAGAKLLSIRNNGAEKTFFDKDGGLAITGAGGIAVGGVTAKKTGTYTATISDFLIPFDTTGGIFTITLPAASGRKGQMLLFKATATSANALTLARVGSDTIDGATSITITPTSVKEGLLLINDGVLSWYQVCEFSAAL